MFNSVLELKNLSLYIEAKNVFKDLSLKLLSGEIHVLLGPNGVGKSSLLKLIAGYPDYNKGEGNIYLDNENISQALPEVRAQKGILVTFQDPCEIEGLSVANFLRTALKMFKDNPGNTWSATVFYQHLYELLDQVGLPRTFTSRSVNCGFSGGEKKRFELLQLLLFKPKFALLDELDSGLDVDARKQVVDTIKSLQGMRTGFLIISHDINFIRKLQPDHIHLLRNGLLETHGPDFINEIEVKGYHVA